MDRAGYEREEEENEAKDLDMLVILSMAHLDNHNGVRSWREPSIIEEAPEH